MTRVVTWKMTMMELRLLKLNPHLYQRMQTAEGNENEVIIQRNQCGDLIELGGEM